MKAIRNDQMNCYISDFGSIVVRRDNRRHVRYVPITGVSVPISREVAASSLSKWRRQTYEVFVGSDDNLECVHRSSDKAVAAQVYRDHVAKCRAGLHVEPVMLTTGGEILNEYNPCIPKTKHPLLQ